MPQVVSCSACQKQFRVADKHLGRTGACPACRATITIGDPAAPTSKSTTERKSQKVKPSPAATPQLTEANLRAALVGPMRPVRATLTYRLGLLVATFVVLLTPVVYLALITATGYGVYYHAVNHQDMLAAVRGRGAALMFLAYVAPMVIGPILILFMLKPFFTRPRHEQRSRSLVRQNEPLLFTFVDMICETVGAPPPRRIDIDCQMNASASFRRGMASMLGKDLVLTIGMPMVAGLSLQQFGGVLAHEFGHFSQGAGMRLTYVLRSVSAWLDRSVNQRDAWDEWLASAAAELDLRLGWVLWLAMFMVWIARRVLWLLMMISMTVVGYVLRQMEYDADRYEARFAGSDAFETTTTKMARLDVAMQKAYAQIGASHRDGKLVDDLPRLVALNEAKLEPSLSNQLAEYLQNARTGLFDSHPTDKDRIANARREDAEGVFHIKGPAGALFSDFPAQCKATTWEFYREVLGDGVKRAQLKPVGAITTELDAQVSAADALYRYLQGTWRPVVRVGLRRDALTPVEAPKAAVAEAHALRTKFEAAVAEQRQQVGKLDKWRERLTVARAYETLYKAEVRLSKKERPEDLPDRDTAVTTRTKAQRRVNILSRQIEEAGEVNEARLTAAIRLLCHRAVHSQLPKGAKLKSRVETLVPALVAIEGQLETINTLREQAGVLSILIAALQRYGTSELLVDRVVQLARDVHPKLTQVREVLTAIPYPFEHTEGAKSLGIQLIPGVPSRDEVGDLLSVTEVAVDAIGGAQHRILSELCGIAEQVEKAIKLAPLPEPSED